MQNFFKLLSLEEHDMCICEYVFMQGEDSYWGKPEGNSAQCFVFYLTLIEIKGFKNLLTSGGNSDCKESA